MPGWDWQESTGTYLFDGNTVMEAHSVTIALRSCEPIGFLEVTRGNNSVSFGLLAPASDQQLDSVDKEKVKDK